MSFRKTLLILVVAAFLPGPVSGQTEPMEYWGHVVDAETGHYVDGARVFVEGMGSRFQVLTDSRGDFVIRGIVPGNYVATVTAAGYRPVREWFEVLPQGPAAQMSTMSMTVRIKYTKTIRLKRYPPGTAPASLISFRELQIPKKARKKFEKGMKELHRRKKPERSVKHFQEAIGLFPNYDQAYVQLGLAHVLLSQMYEAKQVLERGLGVYPENARALGLLGKIYFQEGQLETAAKELQQAVTLNDLLWDAHVDFGQLLLQEGDLDGAYEHAVRAHELNQTSMNVHLLYYNVVVQRGDYAAALKELDEFVELFPKSKSAKQMKAIRPELAKAASAQE